METLFKALFESSQTTQNGVDNVDNVEKLKEVTRDNILGLAKIYHIQNLEG